jgi:hypothetical protein
MKIVYFMENKILGHHTNSMKYTLASLLILSFHFCNGQPLCEIDPLPIHPLGYIKKDKSPLAPYNMEGIYPIWMMGRSIHRGDTSLKTRIEILRLQEKIIGLNKDSIIDTLREYQLIFKQDFSYRHQPTGPSQTFYSFFSLEKADSLINSREFYISIKNQNRFINIRSYSYDKKYLLLKVCYENIGNSSFGGYTIYYFEKPGLQESE